MTVRQVTLRKMTPAEYRAATEDREAESVRVLSKFMPEELAGERSAAARLGSVPTGSIRLVIIS
jgi:hypothetical protein